LDSVENRTGINARLVVDGELSLDEAVEIGLYRIAEEALNNTLKHSQASHVTVDLHQTQNAVTLEIIDDGIGFDLHAGRRSGGMGLESIRERTVALGGRLDIQSKPGHGTHIRVEIEVAQ
jgi:signal transduction histidine kinase